MTRSTEARGLLTSSGPSGREVCSVRELRTKRATVPSWIIAAILFRGRCSDWPRFSPRITAT